MYKRQDNILTPKEEEAVESVRDAGKVALKRRQESYAKKGWEVVCSGSEISFLASYANNYHIKVRCDGLNLFRANGQLFFEIVDLKTTSGSVFKDADLASAIGNFHYATLGSVYLDVVQEALCRPEVWEQLGISQHLPQDGSQLNPYVEFNLFWVSKETNSCRFQDFMGFRGVETESWEYYGNVGYAAALEHYSLSVQQTQELIREASASKSKEQLDAYFDHPVQPTKRVFWAYQEYIMSFGKRQDGLGLMNVSLEKNEDTLRQELNKAFPPPPPPIPILSAVPVFGEKPKVSPANEVKKAAKKARKNGKAQAKQKVATTLPPEQEGEETNDLTYTVVQKLKKAEMLNNVTFEGAFESGDENLHTTKLRSKLWRWLKKEKMV